MSLQSCGGPHCKLSLLDVAHRPWVGLGWLMASILESVKVLLPFTPRIIPFSQNKTPLPSTILTVQRLLLNLQCDSVDKGYWRTNLDT